ncbi:hypothetical protein TKWG_13265 [Advenella kashmirensis WT001]|uniref:Uncharacterized protein n=1 Tax=Advenella kashmirensis (strain DSM 17095 / LMG 22695 / WT001) TaxID=1036672 RepID=I3UCN9_ADVKW|nr:hypothetical protein [Advenella kashmirensis]AFK62777.1 hypothetical protein TKWG_13265 [Advenella kashmirensis WT001]
MATISIDVEELNVLRESLETAKYEAERSVALSIALRDRLENGQDTTTEYFLSTLLVEGDSGYSAISSTAKYLDKLKESVNEQTA